jgi:pilus assembly protein Flp/PilA
MRLFTKLKRDERAATAVEYGLILALIVLAMLTALTGLATKSIEVWTHVATTVTSN